MAAAAVAPPPPADHETSRYDQMSRYQSAGPRSRASTLTAGRAGPASFGRAKLTRAGPSRAGPGRDTHRVWMATQPARVYRSAYETCPAAAAAGRRRRRRPSPPQ